jgi:tRNA 2-thiouridine synthesizing protein A
MRRRHGLLKRHPSWDTAPMTDAPDATLDVKGMTCPLPVLRANRALRGMPPGAVLRVLATDRAAVADFAAFCGETGHALLLQDEQDGVLGFTIRRRAEDPA